MLNDQSNGPFGPRPSHNSLAQIAALYGLHPLPMITFIIVDQMLFASEVASGFVLVVLSFCVALALWLPITILQHYLWGDKWPVAASKAALGSIVTAIPTGLPSAIFLLWGGASAFGWKHRPAAQRQTIDTTGEEH